MTKLVRIGNSTGLTLSREILAASGLARGDDVAVRATAGRIEIEKPQDDYAAAMEAGRSFAARYRRAMAILAK